MSDLLSDLTAAAIATVGVGCYLGCGWLAYALTWGWTP